MAFSVVVQKLDVRIFTKQECIPVGCVPAARRPYAGVCFPGGVCLVLGGVCLVRGVCLVWGVSAWSGGCLPGPGGVCLVWGGVCLVLGCLPGPRGVSAWSGGVSAWWGGLASQHALRQTPSPPVDRQTPVKTLPWPQLRCGR